MSPRRFIAGAVCPECGEMDRLVVEPRPSGEHRRCVNCGFTDERPVSGASPPKTRLDGGLKRPAEDPDTPSDPVRIIDPRRG